MKTPNYLTGFLAFSTIAVAASAQDVTVINQYPWRGLHIGVNVGGAWTSTCNRWTSSGAIIDTGAATGFYNSDCPNSSAFVGGAQIGYNFQFHNIVWGFGADFDAWSSKDHNQRMNYAGEGGPPSGSYEFSERVGSNGFVLMGPRVGYAFGPWLPYLRVGSVFALGSPHSMATYTAPGAAASTASFTGGTNYKSSGFGVGAGVEYALVPPWSFTVDYTHVDFGQGHNSTITCSGTAANCAAFSGIYLDDTHSSFTPNIIRVGVNYQF